MSSLAGVRLGHAAEINHVGIGALDLRHERPIIRCLGVDAFVTDHLDAEFEAGALEHVGDAFAVQLAVMEDEDFLHAEFLGPRRDQLHHVPDHGGNVRLRHGRGGAARPNERIRSRNSCGKSFMARRPPHGRR